MSLSWTRVGAIVLKELRDYRRNRFIAVVTMSIVPLAFVVVPVIQLFKIPVAVSSSVLTTRIGFALLYMLLVPAIVPSVLSAYSIVGEREQGTLEPVLTTPIRREEFLIGKALAVFAPALTVSYAIFGIFLAVAAFFARPVVASAVFTTSHILVQLLFIPLVAGWSVWIGIAISSRLSDVRAAQQLSVFASLPPLAIVALMSLNVLAASTGVALGLGAALLVIDGLGWRAVAAMFDRERLVAGTR